MNNRASLQFHDRRETRFPSSIPLDHSAEGKAHPEHKQETNLDLSINSDIEDNFNLFPDCSTREVEELRAILGADKRSKDDLKLLAKKLQDIPFFKAIIKKFGLDEDPDALLYFFKLIRLKEFNEHSTVYEQGDQSNSQAYVLFSGDAYLVDLAVNTLKADLLNSPPSKVLSISQTSTFDIDASPQLNGTRRVTNVYQMIPESEARPSSLKTEFDFTAHCGLERLGTVMSIKDLHSPDASPNKRSSIDQGHRTVVKQIQRFFAEGHNLPSYLKCQKESPVKPLHPGKHIGQKALWSMQRRDHTIITKTACEFLVVHSDILKYIKKKVDVNKAKRIKLIRDCFPSLQINKDKQVLNFIWDIYSIETFHHNQHITVEGGTSDYFYIIMEGTCDLNKKILVETNPLSNPLHDMKHFFVLPLSSTEHVNIFSLNERSFVGDELLFAPQEHYWYSVKVTSPEARVLAFNRKSFLQRFPKTVIDNLREHYQQRQNHIYQILVQNLQLRGYSLNREVFFESGKITVELEKDSNLRTFYAHHLKPSKEQSQTPMNRLSLESVKDKINSNYSHKLRISNPHVESIGSRTQRSRFKSLGTTEGVQIRAGGGSLSARITYDSPKTAESTEYNSPKLRLPSYFVNQKTELSASGVSKSGKLELPPMSHRDIASTIDSNSAYHLPLSANRASVHRASAITFPTDATSVRKSKESTIMLRDKLEEDLGPDRLSFLKSRGDRRSSSRKKFSLRVVKKDSSGNDSSQNSPKSHADYAQITRTRYKSKFYEEMGTFETLAEVIRSQANEQNSVENQPQPKTLMPNQINLGKPIFEDTSGPSPRLEMVKKNNFINIHVQHKKKLNPLQRFKNRADLL